ncbi:hypothetical protein TNCV_1357161 [Trichonephila clavipes]|uniref:Uncharacterized protein n=1 Tax=Trichonephila clavipes TaxID=2585209 RepID=A0A8X6SBP4_TRICX|nr:hypothetical protein TNCV_1357161 [Trichonephila clavipes]
MDFWKPLPPNNFRQSLLAPDLQRYQLVPEQHSLQTPPSKKRTFSDKGKALFFEDQLKSFELSTGDITENSR